MELSEGKWSTNYCITEFVHYIHSDLQRDFRRQW